MTENDQNNNVQQEIGSNYDLGREIINEIGTKRPYNTASQHIKRSVTVGGHYH